MRIRTALAALAALTLAPAAHAQLGVAVGANFDRVSDIEGNANATFNNASGYHVGVTLNLGVGPIALRPGVFYTDVGDLTTESGRKLDFDLVEAPVDVIFKIPAPIVKPYVLGGPVFRFAQNGDEDGQIEAEDFTVAGAVGAGIEVNTFVFRPYIEARYQFGLQRFTTDIAGIPTGENDTKLNTFMIRLGLTF
jgi:hypothetical protein